ncbi:hypothetical protein K502DRAFT_325284 [Neoconidiobolus thromboides FSU 785]|nr:hypothetical protein K502DRAFT_325284 [Neoconidiobolus thromboides FSU 785]
MNIIRPGVVFSPGSGSTISTSLSRRPSSRTSSTSNEQNSQRNNLVKSPKPILNQQSILAAINSKLMAHTNNLIEEDYSHSDESESKNSDFSDEDNFDKEFEENSNSEINSNSNSSFSTDTGNLDSLVIEARVNRKILDLEISNKSLLAINTVLEAKVRKQGDEIETLKKSLQGVVNGEFIPLPKSDLDIEESEESIDDEDEQKFNRILASFDKMLNEGKGAIDFTSHKNSGRVLPSHTLDSI